MSKLKYQVDKSTFLKSIESYPMAFLEEKNAETEEEAIEHFYNAVYSLHKIGKAIGEENLPEFFKIVDYTDFHDIKMILSEWYLLLQKK